MGSVGIAALVANVVSFGLLWAYRKGCQHALSMDMHTQ